MNGGIDRRFPQRAVKDPQKSQESNSPDSARNERETPLTRSASALHAIFSADTWEKYSLGMVSEEDRALLEEHLLVCSTCQDVLAKVDEYVGVAKTAMALKAAGAGDRLSVSDFRTRRRLSKPVKVAAALAGGLILFR